VSRLDYADYLESAAWLALRERAIERDGRRCRLCNGQRELQVHHRTYERIGHERLDDLTTLCRRCHKRYHAEPAAPKRRPNRKRKPQTLADSMAAMQRRNAKAAKRKPGTTPAAD
jgi:5-methylcytosine-specific restriction endonuclease McrA